MGSLGTSVTPVSTEIIFLPLVWAKPQAYTPTNNILEANWINPQATMRPRNFVP